MNRIKLIAAISFYVATLVWAYVAIVSPEFSYFGYSLHWPGSKTVAWVFALSLVPATCIPEGISRPSGLIVWWIYGTVYIPSLLLPVLSLTLSYAQLLPLQGAMLLSMLWLILLTRMRGLALPQLRMSPRIFWPSVFLVWAGGLAFVYLHFNVTTLAANLASLFAGGSEYTIRTAYLDRLSQAGRLLGYTVGQVGEAIGPFLVAYALVYRKRWLLAAGVAGQLLIFAVMGAKSIFFSTFFLALVYVMFRRSKKNFGLVLALTLTCVVFLAAGVDALTNGVYFSSITTRRTLMDPGLLTGFYYEHYSQAAHAGLGYHFSRGGEAVPAPSYEIGLVYFGNEHIDANANLWAEGFADFGFAGIAGFTLLLSGIVWFYDSVSSRRKLELAVTLFAMQAFDFSNSAPLTTLITHGGIASALLIWCAPVGEAEIEAGEEVLPEESAVAA
ncbi:MAG: hypothetical protein WCE75_08125 [Terracidiphilus sp.]